MNGRAKMKKLLFSVFTILVFNNAYAVEVAYFNSSILGKNVNSSFELFQVKKNQKSNLLYPTNIKIDIKDNICTAVALFFPENIIKPDEMRKIINTRYPDTEYIAGENFWAWRVEKKSFTITMSIKEDCIKDYNHIEITYLMWDVENIESKVERVKKILKHLNQNGE